MSAALTRFREAYSAMLIAAESVRAELDPIADEAIPSDIRRIQAAVSTITGIPIARITGPRRDDATVVARHLSMLLCTERTQHNACGIARAHNRGHGTVEHAIAAISERIAKNPRLREQLASIRANIASNDNRS